MLAEVAISIPVRNRHGNRLRYVVRSLRQEFSSVGVIIADCNSHSEVSTSLRDMCKEEGAIYLRIGRWGVWNKGAVANTGVMWAIKNLSPKFVGVWDADKIAGDGFGLWALQSFAESVKPIAVTNKSVRIGDTGFKHQEGGRNMRLSEVPDLPLTEDQRRAFFKYIRKRLFSPETLDKPLGKVSYNILMPSDVFMFVGGQEESISGYWQDDVDLCMSLVSNGFPVIVCPKRCCGYHIPHGKGSRAIVIEVMRIKGRERKKVFLSGKHLLSNVGVEFGKSKIMEEGNFYEPKSSYLV